MSSNHQTRAAAAISLEAMTAAYITFLDHLLQLPWAVVSVLQMCEWGGHTTRHLAQVNRELQLAALGRSPVVS